MRTTASGRLTVLGSAREIGTVVLLIPGTEGESASFSRQAATLWWGMLGSPVCDEQASVPPRRIPADPEAETSHRPSAVADGINKINGSGDAGTAGDIDELDVHYGPLTGREWIALSKCFDMRDPHDRRPGESQYRREFLRLVEYFKMPVARWRDCIMAESAIDPRLPLGGHSRTAVLHRRRLLPVPPCRRVVGGRNG
jgi:hypothetical protein